MGPWLLAAVAGPVAVQLAIIYVPVLQSAFGTAALGPIQMAVVAAASTTVFVAVEIEKWLRRRGSVEG